MKLYAGCDLHSTNNFWGVMDENGKRIFSKKLPNTMPKIFKMLEPFKPDLAGIAVESTYNWYWIVDQLMAEEYPVRLANPAAMKKYSGLDNRVGQYPRRSDDDRRCEQGEHR